MVIKVQINFFFALLLTLQFLDLISTSGKWDQKSIETPIMLKEG